MPFPDQQDFLSELSLWVEDAVEKAVEIALGWDGVEDMFSKQQLKVIALVASYAAGEFLASYNKWCLEIEEGPLGPDV